MENMIKAYLFAIIASFCISITFVITKVILQELNILSTSVYSFVFSFLFSIIFLKFIRKRKIIEPFKQHWKHMSIYGILGGVGGIIWFYSIDILGPNLLSFLLRFGLIFTIILSVVFLKERFNRFEALGMVIAIIGALIMTYTTENMIIIITLFVILMCAMFSVSQLIVKTHIKKIDPFVINHIRITFSFVIFLTLGIATSSLQVPSLNAIILAAITGIITGLIGFGLFFKALEIAELSKLSLVKVLDPFLVILFSFLILGDILTQQQFFGGLFVIFGIVILIIARHRPQIRIEKDFT